MNGREMRVGVDKLEVWIGCLACYNEGRLVGRWFDADEAATVTVEAVHEGSRLTGINSPDAARWSPDEAVVLVPEYHEEIWVFDHQGFGRLLTGECSPSEAQRIAELVADLDDNDRDALAAWVANHGISLDAEQIDRFREAYRGLHDSEVAYAQEFADDIGAVNEDATWPNTYIDWERAARDLFMDLWSVNALTSGGIHVFHDC